MSDDFMKRMFNPFEQESKENALAGTGLGLSIVQRIVIMMGGTITVRSVLAKGTTFTVTLDRKIGEEPEGKTKKHQVKPVSLKGKRILLCEDNEVNTMVATRFLEKTGCETECAVDGEEGVQKFLSSPVGYYSLILMDIRMPRMDGLAATRKIRSMDREDAKTIPIIAMSANAFEEDRKKSLEAGMNDHLSKPFEPENFFKILETYANGK
jgi:CheY-like chemotaxis protein